MQNTHEYKPLNISHLFVYFFPNLMNWLRLREDNGEMCTISLVLSRGRWYATVSLESNFEGKSIFSHLIKLRGKGKVHVPIHVILVVQAPHKSSIKMGIKYVAVSVGNWIVDCSYD